MQSPATRSRAPAVLGLLGSLVALWTAGTLCLIALSDPPALPTTRSSLPPRTPPGPPARVTLEPFPRSLAELRAVNDAATRLRPDARFVAAFADVQRLRGRPSPVAAARLVGDHWVVSVDGQPVGELPLLATPADALAALARSIPARPPSAPDPAAPAHVADVAPGAEIAALRALAGPVTDAGPPHPSAAARALATLFHRTWDRLDANDALAARALAAAAWARAVGSPAPDAEVLIATEMAYTSGARALAASLPEGDPVRLYLDRAQGLGFVPRPGARYLHYRIMASFRTPEGPGVVAQMPAEARSSLAVVGWLPWTVNPADFGARLDAQRESPSRTLAALQREVGVTPAGAPLDDATVLTRTEALLAHPAEALPWLDAELSAARIRSATWNAMQRSLDVELQSRSDARAARGQLRAMERGAFPAVHPMLTWFDALVSAEEGNLAWLGGSAVSPDALPGALRLRAADESRAWTRRPALLHIASHLDARPTHRMALLDLVREERLDPLWHRALCQAFLAEPLDDDTAAACRRRDALAPGAPPSPPEAPEQVEARFVARNAQARTWAQSRAEYGRWLIGQGRAAETVAMARAWIASHPDGLEPAFARTGMARAQLAMNDPTAAWASIEPALASWQGGAMEMGVTVLIALGRLDEARDLAQQRLARYPGVEQAATVAEVLWRQRRHAEAAGALAPYAPGSDAARWHAAVGEALSRVFASQEPAAVVEAATAMGQARINVGAVEALAVELERDGHPAHALAVHETLSAPGLRGLALIAVRHRMMAAARSPGEAQRWLEATVPPQGRGPVAMFAFGEVEDALVWSAADGAEADADGTAYLWLLRAGTLLRAPPDAARRARVEAAVASPTNPYHHVTRYLLGLESLEEVLALPTAEDRRAEVAFWVAFRAHCEGRLEEAAEWYRFLVRRGPESEGEVGWALRPLRRWSDEPGWLDAVVDPWASAHAGFVPGAAPPAAGEEPAEDGRHRRGRHRAPGDGHHRHRRHHSQRTVHGGRS